jgi:predicted O-methyltransferase YrrM
MKQLFLEGYEEYLNHMRNVIPDYDNSIGHGTRRKQCQTLLDSINENFNFDKLIVLETGASSSYDDGLFGLFLGYVAKKTNGKMTSVDISSDTVDKSKEIFQQAIPELDYSIHVEDSVSFLKNIEEIPNFVHLDSWDFDLFNPLPCALHGWEEFKSIESKMESGSIIIIDDNYRQGTYIEWFHGDGKRDDDVVKYPMLGKGAHVYQHVLNNITDWVLIGSHYDTYDNIKIIIQKK